MKNADAQDIFQLPAVLTIADADALHEKLLTLQTQSTPTIDASQVERIDTAAFQQLLAFKLSLVNTDNQLHWQGLSEVFMQSAKQLGLERALSLA